MASNTTEWLDIVDPSTGAVTGRASRADVHRDGLWHQVFHCMVLRPSVGTVVLQRRSSTKAAFPDKLDLSATGHLESGETPVDGVREMREELGIDIAPDALVPIGQRLLADDNGEGRNRELVHLYFVADDRPLDDYAPDPSEVSALVEIRAVDLVGLLGDEIETASVTEWSPAAGPTPAEMTRTDLVVDTGQYWPIVAVMCERFLVGARPLAI
ncbi:MAG: NUDIX domain-containing protein [Actinomycetota bacterium]